MCNLCRARGLGCRASPHGRSFCQHKWRLTWLDQGRLTGNLCPVYFFRDSCAMIQALRHMRRRAPTRVTVLKVWYLRKGDACRSHILTAGRRQPVSLLWLLLIVVAGILCPWYSWSLPAIPRFCLVQYSQGWQATCLPMCLPSVFSSTDVVRKWLRTGANMFTGRRASQAAWVAPFFMF